MSCNAAVSSLFWRTPPRTSRIDHRLNLVQSQRAIKNSHFINQTIVSAVNMSVPADRGIVRGIDDRLGSDLLGVLEIAVDEEADSVAVPGERNMRPLVDGAAFQCIQ